MYKVAAFGRFVLFIYFDEFFSDKVRARAVDLISKAYSSITLEAIAAMTGLTTEIAGNACVEKGWFIEADTRIVRPVRENIQPSTQICTEDQVHRLTNFVSYLEN